MATNGVYGAWHRLPYCDGGGVIQGASRAYLNGRGFLFSSALEPRFLTREPALSAAVPMKRLAVVQFSGVDFNQFSSVQFSQPFGVLNVLVAEHQ